MDLKPQTTLRILQGDRLDTPIPIEHPMIVGVTINAAPDFILCPEDPKVFWPIVMEVENIGTIFDWGDEIQDQLAGLSYVVRTHHPIDLPSAFMLIVYVKGDGSPDSSGYLFIDVPGFMADHYDSVSPTVWEAAGLQNVDPFEAFKDPKDEELEEKRRLSQR
jgi:hypothetical protein